MAWSITMTVSADGTVAIVGTDRHLGSAYYVGSKDGGDLNGATQPEVAERVRTRLRIRQDRGWDKLTPLLRDAAAQLISCLPPAEAFDELGAPR